MIEEKVSLETARLAKTKGFDYGQPTSQDLLERWLRETHKLRVFVGWRPNKKVWDVHTFHLGLSGPEYVKRYKNLMSRPTYATYEQAREAGIVEALNMIP